MAPFLALVWMASSRLRYHWEQASKAPFTQELPMRAKEQAQRAASKKEIIVVLYKLKLSNIVKWTSIILVSRFFLACRGLWSSFRKAFAKTTQAVYP